MVFFRSHRIWSHLVLTKCFHNHSTMSSKYLPRSNWFSLIIMNYKLYIGWWTCKQIEFARRKYTSQSLRLAIAKCWSLTPINLSTENNPNSIIYLSRWVLYEFILIFRIRRTKMHFLKWFAHRIGKILRRY